MMAGVYYSSRLNSTFFTTCCHVAICDNQERCPKCAEDVYPFDERMDARERAEVGGGYHNHNTRMARMGSARQRERR